MRVLIGSSIYQDEEILKEFLQSLKELNKESIEVNYMFIDDNKDSKSSTLLEEFKDEIEGTFIYLGYEEKEEYICDDYSHYWSDNLVEKVTRYKNFIINKAIEDKYDYLFFIDSDIILHPKTLNRLLSINKDIVSNIFWTKWNPQDEEMPQVWLEDSYKFYKTYGRKDIDLITMEKEKLEFIEMLRNPGTYKVAGLGACTLIKRNVLEKGVNFSNIYNISFWGEDRHFCVRAVANNFELYVDTYYPAYHIYRKENLKGVNQYKINNTTRDIQILGTNLFNLVREGINRLNTYNYENEDNSYMMFFTKEFLEENSSIYLNRINEIKENTIINECYVLESNMRFNNSFDVFTGTIEYIEKGFKNEESFYEESVGQVEVIKLDKGIWRINSFNKLYDKDDLEKPVQRIVRKKPHLTLSMVVKNEEHRYIKEVLNDAKEYIDEAVIIDDGSTDNTVNLIKEILCDVKLKIIKNEESLFKTEHKLRRQQWEETIKTNPEWILFLDADEIFESNFKNRIKELLNNKYVDMYKFRLYDMWNDTYYRSDNLWNAHLRYSPFLLRYQKNFKYEFNSQNLHCGRMPANSKNVKWENSDLRLKHLGWSKEADRIEKYKRYIMLDSEGKFGSLKQYESILDENPRLEKWINEI